MSDVLKGKHPHPVTGLYPIKLLTSEASLGLIEGEVRGFNATVAEQLIVAKQGEYVEPTVNGKRVGAKVEKA